MTRTEMRPARSTATAQRIWTYLGLATVTLFNVISQANFDPDAHNKAWGDALEYYRMSEQTAAQVGNPFALRMLSPWLVHRAQLLTGISADWLWLALTVLCTLAAIIVFFEFLWSHLKVRLFTAALAAVALACTFWYAPYAFSNPYLVDPLNNLGYVCAIWLAVRRRLFLFTGVVVVGSVNKETMLLLAPLYPLLVWARGRTLRDRGVVGGVVAMMVAVGLYLAYRIWAEHLIGADYGFGSGQANKGLLENIRFALSVNKGSDQLELFSTFHFLWLVFAYGLYRLYLQERLRAELLVVSLWLLACCVAGRLVATDTARVFVMMAPLVLGVAAVLLDQQRRQWCGLLLFLYIALSLRWFPMPSSLALDIAGAAAFFMLTMFTVTSVEERDIASVG